MKISIVIPARNEAATIQQVVRGCTDLFGQAQVIVVDDGSTDETGPLASSAGAEVIRHIFGRGNGAAIKTGIRHAKGDVVVCMDGDGQHQPKDIPRLLSELDQGFDLAVGARSRLGQSNWWRGLANKVYNRFASWMTGHKVEDLTSGFRAMRRDRIVEFLPLLPNQFSYPTTCTMAFFRAGYGVKYVPIEVRKRHESSQSHIRIWRDGLRFLLIIFKVSTLYSPLKVFVPLAGIFAITGIGYYAHTYATAGRFTNFGNLLLVSSILIFLIGLVSEQISTLMYLRDENT